MAVDAEKDDLFQAGRGETDRVTAIMSAETCFQTGANAAIVSTETRFQTNANATVVSAETGLQTSANAVDEIAVRLPALPGISLPMPSIGL